MTQWRNAIVRPALGLAGLGAAILMIAAPAFSQDTNNITTGISVLATIEKDINITVNEDINITKTVNLDVTVTDIADKFAESEADASQLNTGSKACENCSERSDTLSGSALGNTGITTINQAGGNINNQAAEVSAAVDTGIGEGGGGGEPGTPTGVGFAESSASATQENVNNTVDVLQIVFRDAIITNSVEGNVGITYVNQAVGNFNNQSNVLSLAVSLRSAGVALSEADLGQLNTSTSTETPETVGENNSTKSASIDTGSISGNTGIVGVNQASGYMANQANLVSFAAVSPGASAP